MDPRQVELVERYADMIQIGARNMQNFVLLTEVGSTRKPVLLKRGMSADDRRSADERRIHPVARQSQRGAVRTRHQKLRRLRRATCSTWRRCRPCKGMSHLPIIVDPSHATGRPDLIPAMRLAGVAAGADGVHIEVHNCPEQAMSDGPQALLPEQYAEVAAQIRKLAALFGSTFRRRKSNKALPKREIQKACMRRLFIAGNWKMNLDRAGAVALARDVAAGASSGAGRGPGRLPAQRLPRCRGRCAAGLARGPGCAGYVSRGQRGLHR